MNKLLNDAILRVGEVSSIDGRRVFIKVDKNKNSSDLFFNGTIIKNVSVGSFIEIRKGLFSIIGKADGEFIVDDKVFQQDEKIHSFEKYTRILKLFLIGFIGIDGIFHAGIIEMPLLGDEAFIVTSEKLNQIFDLSRNNSEYFIQVASTEPDQIPIKIPIDNLFNGHIAIFGNTGSGKSNSLAALYQGLFNKFQSSEKFSKNCRFILFDFNGEYSNKNCITKNKIIYNLNSETDNGDKFPFLISDFFEIETFSTLIEASEKVQKPFIKRTLKKFLSWKNNPDINFRIKGRLLSISKRIFVGSNKETADKLLDYMQDAIEIILDDDLDEYFHEEIKFHSSSKTFFFINEEGETIYFNNKPDAIEQTKLYKFFRDQVHYDKLLTINPLLQFQFFLILQMIEDVLSYKAQNEHIYPVINRIKAKQHQISRIVTILDKTNLWKNSNFIVVNMNDVSLEMKKILPLIISKNIYKHHKLLKNRKSLNIIIDEAHNILSKYSSRETDDWKDYRIETFEEIIKEGRKFGVFLTISSQRPNDISETIISQAHNYFIHQLVNDRDIKAIENAVSYIDLLTIESLPILPIGTCIFSGVSSPIPMKIKFYELHDDNKPKSNTIKFSDLIS